MVGRMVAAGVPFARVAADEVYGGNRGLREWLENGKIGYGRVVSGPKSTHQTRLTAMPFACRGQMRKHLALDDVSANRTSNIVPADVWPTDAEIAPDRAIRRMVWRLRHAG